MPLGKDVAKDESELVRLLTKASEGGQSLHLLPPDVAFGIRAKSACQIPHKVLLEWWKSAGASVCPVLGTPTKCHRGSSQTL